jgi:patatin-like phospholipase/acyl hydrolase
LDGGGVRGLSSLLILKKIMEALDPENPPKPYDYFDMIGVEKQNTYLYQQGQAFRFNVDQGLENVGSEEAKKLVEIESGTRRYIQTERTFNQLEVAAARLQERDCISEFA